MLIEELAEREGDSPSGGMARALHSFAQVVAEEAKQHAKRILTQLSEFDLHNEVHLAAVLSNLEQVIGTDNAQRLSIYELFFLYAASHLHDVGMALPDWELNAIEAVEAEDISRASSSSDESWHRDFSTNGGRPLSFSAARDRVTRHSKDLYKDFAVVVKWSFAPASEDQLVDYLAQTVVDYQEFRSGFMRTLQAMAGDELCRYVRSLRTDFLRRTHHIRSHYYIKNLARAMPNEIPQAWREALSRDLANVCRAHGEEMPYVENLKCDAQYVGPHTANLQFVASLVRVADIVHFSLDRAPAALLSEMQFRSEESFVHWAVKQQGVTYDIQESGVGGTKTIKFKAFCANPRYYYELHRYLDGVDHELANFGRMSRRWNQAFGKHVSGRWTIPLADEVDRSGIEHDSDKFVPVRGLSFSLEQKRILELLMGVRLYKDEHACLRELYQNSLDACKCMITLSEGQEEGRVEFWLERRNAGNDVYLCCLDNGVGMTKDIIEQHLLRVGNSYYTSPAFERLRISHEHRFTPTSQFGIGILSCFMVGDTLDIVTKPMQEFSEDTSATRCTIDGVHEDFYYAVPDPADLEKIGKHGTIVRIHLRKPDLITDVNDGKVWFRYYALQTSQRFQKENKKCFANWDKHIHNIVTQFVSLPSPEVLVTIRLADGSPLTISRSDAPFRWADFGIDEADVVRLQEFVRTEGIDENSGSKAALSNCSSYPCKVEHDGVQFSWLLQLPTSKNGETALRTFGNFGVSVDGIRVRGTGAGSRDDSLEWLSRNGHLNFVGEIRPVLSVDRTSATSWPDSTAQVCDALLEKVLTTTIETARRHLEEEPFAPDDPIVLATWDRLLNWLSVRKGHLLTELSLDSRYSHVLLRDLGALANSDSLTLREFVDTAQMCFPRVAFRELSHTVRLLFLGKCGNARDLTVNNNGVRVTGTGLSAVVEVLNSRYESESSEILLKCDTWEGTHREYDLVTDYWPIVPERLFKRLLEVERTASKVSDNERAMVLHKMGNGISSVAAQEPCFVHPRHGLYDEGRSYSFHGSPERCKIGRFETRNENHWLFEINEYWNKDEPVNYILFAFVSPRSLTSEEDAELKDFESREPEYVEGVRNGWSLLFLGREHTPPIILPGVVSRAAIAKAIPEEVVQKLAGDEYHFLDGTALLDVRMA